MPPACLGYEEYMVNSSLQCSLKMHNNKEKVYGDCREVMVLKGGFQ